MNRKLILNIILCLFTFLFALGVDAAGSAIVLNTPLTDDINHTFKYPNIQIDNSVNPYSITLSIENGYFNASNSTLNNKISTYFEFRGGTSTSNAYVSTLNTTSKYKLITFNLKSSVDISNSNVKANVINSIKSFLGDIVFYNNKDQDAKFILTFSEVNLSFSNVENGISNVDVIAFKDPSQKSEHYYVKIDKEGIKWTEAYDIATTLRWNNLKGYLVTITSEAEHNFIYQSLGSIRGWMGAASIKNADKVTYNTKGISWANTVGDLKPSAGYGTGNPDNDTLIKQYWHWVAGPEAGKLVFENGKYTNFTNGEPNNYNGAEWCGEYGHGDNGMWNDYPDDAGDIEGFYVEFGGYDDDVETVKPISFEGTFKWTDYDFRNVEPKIEESINKINYTNKTTEAEIVNAVQNAVKDTGVDNITTEVINKNVNNGTLSFDIKVTIGNKKEVYTMHVEKKIAVENNPTKKDDTPTIVNFSKGKKSIVNPDTLDELSAYKGVGITALILIGYIALKSSKR